jgi:hypothetical protein
MVSSEYKSGRKSGAEGPVGEAHAVIAEAATGEGPFTAECGAQAEIIDGPFPPESAGPCPACARVTGLSV